jgi:hypothetical protein
VNDFWFNMRIGRYFIQWPRGRWTPHATRMGDTWMHVYKVRPYSVRVFVLFGRTRIVR